MQMMSFFRCFNPTLVRLKLIAVKGETDYEFSFNPTLVRLKQTSEKY